MTVLTKGSYKRDSKEEQCEVIFFAEFGHKVFSFASDCDASTTFYRNETRGCINGGRK